MKTTLILALMLLPAAQEKGGQRQWNPIAPSLPLLSDKEYEHIEQVIDRFIDVEVGKLKGKEASRAIADFNALGPEAIPALIDGLNRAANMESSCPAVLIAKKLNKLLGSSNDTDLLEFARENIGAGVKAQRHMGVIKDLRIFVLLRKSAVQKAAAAVPAGGLKKAPSLMTIGELAEAAGNTSGKVLKQVLIELEQRQGSRVVDTLGIAATSSEADVGELARGLLLKHLGRQTPATVKNYLKHDRLEVRLAAIKTVGSKGWRLGGELIDLLSDPDPDVRQAARQALVQLSRGQDFGPERDASGGELEEAILRWREWWSNQKK
jgi:HEAT repeat protein